MIGGSEASTSLGGGQRAGPGHPAQPDLEGLSPQAQDQTCFAEDRNLKELRGTERNWPRNSPSSLQFRQFQQIPRLFISTSPFSSRPTLSWTGQDSGAGVRNYDVQVRDASTPTWTPWLTATTSTEAQFTGSPGHSYYFQIRATDQVNNTGAWQQAGPVTISSVTKYYTFGSQRVAMRQGDEVYYLHGDHLGSTSLTTDGSGAVVAQARYLPYGQERWSDGAAVTDFGFTGQRHEAGFGLMDYQARYYDPLLGRFVSPDTVVPEAGNPQSLNRYSYVVNNPVKFVDPSGHIGCELGARCPNPVTPPSPGEDPGWDRTVSFDPDFGYGDYLRGRTHYERYLSNPEAYVNERGSYGADVAITYGEYALGSCLECIVDSRLEGGMAQSLLEGDSTDLLGGAVGELATNGGGVAATIIALWKGKGIPGRGYHNETIAPRPVKVEDVLNQWEAFLGPGPHTNIHPRTGLPDPDRIVSADGTRSIRYGSHEINSSPTKHHYHEETWTYDPVNHVMNVDNTIVRVPLR